MIIRTCLDKFAHCQALVSGAVCPASGAIWEKFKSIEGSNYWFRTEYWTTLFLFDTNLNLVLSFISKFLLFERGFSQQKRIVLENLTVFQLKFGWGSVWNSPKCRSICLRSPWTERKDMKVHVYRWARSEGTDKKVMDGALVEQKAW